MEMTAPIISNRNTYLAIAEEALAKALEIEAKDSQPMPEQSPGTILVRDPAQASFKQSLIAIVFAGVYLDAFLSVATRHQRRVRIRQARVGSPHRRPRKSRNRYTSALTKLGITDAEILTACDRFKDARDQLVHEQPIKLSQGKSGEILIAQREAEHALSFVRAVTARWVAGQIERHT